MTLAESAEHAGTSATSTSIPAMSAVNCMRDRKSVV